MASRLLQLPAALQHSLNGSSRYRVVITKHAIRWLFKLEELVHGGEPALIAAAADCDVLTRYSFSAFRECMLKGLQTAKAVRRLGTANVGHACAALFDQVFCRQRADLFISRTNVIHLHPRRHAIDQHIGDFAAF
jgi:hypothetical protein